MGSWITATTGTNDLPIAAPSSLLYSGGSEHGPHEIHFPNLHRNVQKVLLGMGVEDPTDWGLHHAFPVPSH